MERIFAHKADPAKQDQRLLVKWRGLPYAESTFESLNDVLKIGGQQDIIEYQVWRFVTVRSKCARVGRDSCSSRISWSKLIT